MGDGTSKDLEMVDEAALEAMTDEQREFFEERLAALEEQLAQAERERDEAKAAADKWRPDFDVSARLFGDVEDVMSYFSEQELKDMAAAELKEINRVRRRNGDEPIKYTKAEWDEKIREAALELVADRTREVPTSGPMMQTLKMYHPGLKRLVAIPYEPQINNMRGSLEDALARYRNKGWKIASVNGGMLCGAGPCWAPALMENGQYTFGGFCSEDHLRRAGQKQTAITPAMAR